MKEVVLRMFFEGHATVREVVADLDGTRALDDPAEFRTTANYSVERMGRTFQVEPGHLIGLIDAVIAGELSREDLGTILFCMEAAPERWLWDADDTPGERVAEAVFLLGTPEINYPLTEAVLRKIRVYLETGEVTLNSGDLAPRR